MEYQQIANFLDRGAALNTWNQPFKFRTKIWVEINDESRGTYSVNRRINIKTSMLRSSLCDYSHEYILVKGNMSVNKIAAEVNMSVNNTAADGAAANNINKKVIFKNCAPFTDCKRIIKIHK